MKRICRIFAAILAAAALCAVMAVPAMAYDAGGHELPENGQYVIKNGAVIDYSDIDMGMVHVRAPGAISTRTRLMIQNQNENKTYEITNDAWTSVPLTCGSGEYKIILAEQVENTKYRVLVSLIIMADIQDISQAYISQNAYLRWSDDIDNFAAELCGNLGSNQDKINAIYDYVVAHMSYDYDFAAQVDAGNIKSYIPSPDRALMEQTGVCVDYAALMAAMLRSQGVPCKLVTGYAGNEYHAWVSVYDNNSWTRYDPTFESTGNKSVTVMSFIAQDENYIATGWY